MTGTSGNMEISTRTEDSAKDGGSQHPWTEFPVAMDLHGYTHTNDTGVYFP